MTQRDRLKQFFISRANEWIPLPEILSMYISQYGSRILELRRSGMVIENKWEIIEGVKHSWFRYVPGPDKQMEFIA